ncbi:MULTISPECIES: GNAT family N-acetyltransferase [Caproicibacterium]|uniref:GNAT family N-acetyltransferase n=1 Tax=Caproicibacterium argilliputei TaxID=3030016 RepID=A0AA97D762_9FIRM|nr:GNAT family N-acetyltransferase [Caproicibacterium argilliputei]WOC31775.1 GNAT family N-acetyltransferase [Caproicibacterium argilliputei]
MDEIRIAAEDIQSEDARLLIDELSMVLLQMTGSDGRSTFCYTDMADARSVFAVARDAQGNPLGCGALRRWSEDTAEIKRMYARKNAQGVGSKLIAFLEQSAQNFQFERVQLQTRVVNQNAVRFYERNGYSQIPNYGIYEHLSEAICFQKELK